MALDIMLNALVKATWVEGCMRFAYCDRAAVLLCIYVFLYINSILPCQVIMMNYQPRMKSALAILFHDEG